MRSKFREIIFTLVAILFLLSCSEEKPKPYIFNGQELSRLTNLFFSGDSSANSLLGFLFNNVDPKLIEVNNLFIDSVTFGGDNTVYTLLLESRNPAFNLFAVIDKKMNVLLKDNSLNGNLAFGFQNFNNNTYAVIIESFKAKDTINIKRTSLYEIKSNLSNLIFRSATGFDYGRMSIASKITSFSKDEIKLTFTTKNIPLFKIKEDGFIYDAVTHKYVSANNYLRNFIIDQISRIKINKDIKEITDRSSFESLLSGKEADVVYTKFSKNDYTIYLSKDWREFENFAITKYVKNEFRGNKYINERLGASIFLIKLPDMDSAEMFIEYKLVNKNNYEHPVRYSDLQESGRHFVNFYEYSCGKQKFLLILEAPKFTYVRNLEIYENIVQTFKIIC